MRPVFASASSTGLLSEKKNPAEAGFLMSGLRPIYGGLQPGRPDQGPKVRVTRVREFAGCPRSRWISPTSKNMGKSFHRVLVVRWNGCAAAVELEATINIELP